MATKDDMLKALSVHIGRSRGIPADHLALILDSSTRQVRELVTQLRQDGVAVCGHPGTGYYIAASAEELEETCQFLRARALHSLMLESKLRKVPLADLLGQMHLRT